MKFARKILAASMLASSPFWLVDSLAAASIGMGAALKDAAGSNVETVRAVGADRGGRAGRSGVAGAGGYIGAGRYVGAGRWAGAGWGAGPGWRPGYGLAAGAIVGGAVAASQPGYGYGGYGPDYGYAGYDQGYPTGYYTSIDGQYDGYGYYEAAPGGAYLQGCSYVGGPKIGSWACR
jgi:hypothetical protein